MSEQAGADHDEQSLLTRVVKGDQYAFRILYEEYADLIFRFALSIVRQPHLAEDVLQETMIVIWKRAKTFKGNSKLSTWILGIARNLAFSALRKERRGERVSEEKTMHDPAKQAELSVHVERALGKLSDAHREVVHLVYYEEMTLREAAEILGIPEGTVKSRMHNARKMLAEELAT